MRAYKLELEAIATDIHFFVTWVLFLVFHLSMYELNDVTLLLNKIN